VGKKSFDKYGYHGKFEQETKTSAKETVMNMSSRFGSRAITVIAILAALALLSGCVPRLNVNPVLPDVVLVASTPSTPETPDPNTPPPAGVADMHFVQPDDFFITEDALTDQGWIYARIGKMITPASEDTKWQAQFLVTMDGSTVWTKYFKKTRIAKREDLVLGREVIFFDVTDQNGYYRYPESNQEGRAGYWLNSRIVDVSELFKKVVMVAEGLKVNENAVRVIAE